MRYRAKVAYNINHCKFTPFAAVELFHQLNDKEVNKVRYSLGGSYKLTKQHFISMEYHYQDYLKKDNIKNIIAIQYTFKF